jgi:hypothetical protein
MEDATFTTRDGKRHALEITAAIARRAKRDLGINLVDVAGGQVFRKLAADRDLLLDVLWLVASESAAEPLDRDAFEASLDGASIDAAGDALIAAIVGFSPSHLQTPLRTVWRKSKEVLEAAALKVVERLESPQTDREIMAQIEAAVSDPAESLEKAPRRTR